MKTADCADFSDLDGEAAVGCACSPGQSCNQGDSGTICTIDKNATSPQKAIYSNEALMRTNANISNSNHPSLSRVWHFNYKTPHGRPPFSGGFQLCILFGPQLRERRLRENGFLYEGTFANATGLRPETLEKWGFMLSYPAVQWSFGLALQLV